MTPTLLMLVPPFALLVWRQDTPSVLALLGAMALVAYLDWSAHTTDWNGSVSVDIDHVNHAVKVLGARVEALADTSMARALAVEAKIEETDKNARETLAMSAQVMTAMGGKVKLLEESVERHATQLATNGQRKSLL